VGSTLAEAGLGLPGRRDGRHGPPNRGSAGIHPAFPPVAARLSEVRERNPDLGRSREEFVAALSSDVPDHPPSFERVKLVNVGAEDLPDDELAALEVGPNRCAAD